MRLLRWILSKLRRPRTGYGEFHGQQIPNTAQTRAEIERVAKTLAGQAGMPVSQLKGGADRYMASRDEPTPVQKILDNWNNIDNGPRKDKTDEKM